MLGSLSCDTQFSNLTVVVVCIYKFLTDNGGTPPGESKYRLYCARRSCFGPITTIHAIIVYTFV